MPTFTRIAVFNLNNNFVVINTGGQITYSSDGVNWSNANAGTGQTLRGAAFGLNTYIVVGDNGFMARATDLTSWQTVNTGTTQNLNSIEFAESRFRAVGAGGTVLSSTDGITFSPEISGTTQDLRTIRYTNNRWIAVGTNGTLITAVSGSGWTNPVPAIDSRPLYGIAYKAGMTYPYTAGKKVSTDGVNWTSNYPTLSYPNPFPGSTNVTTVDPDSLNGYIYAYAGGFGMAGKGELGLIGTRTSIPATYVGYAQGNPSLPRWSTNGATWNRYTDNFLFQGMFFSAVTMADLNGWLFQFNYADGLTGGTNYPCAWMLRSDATNYWNWVDFNSTFGNTPTSIIYGDNSGTYSGGTWWWYSVASGRFSTVNYWTEGVRPILGAYGNGYYVLISTTQTSSIGSALTTSNWQQDAWRATNLTNDRGNFTRISAGSTGVIRWPTEIGRWSNSTTYGLLQADMCFGNGRFVIVGPRRDGATSTTPNAAGTKYFTVVYSSDNGATWSSRVFTESAGFDTGGRCAGSANEIVMSAKWYNNGTPGWVLRTTDCVNYTAYYTGYASTINEIKYLNGWFYTVHDNGGIARSSNGITWTTLVAGTESAIFGGTLSDVYFINSQYIVTSTASTYQTTTNLSTYTNQPAATGSFLYWDGTRLITCFGVNNEVRTSTNGTTWTGTSTKPITSIAAKAGTYVAVLEGQSIFYRTTDLVNWTDINLNTTSGVGVIIRDSTGLERLQSYDPGKSNYLCTRIIQENFVTADGTTIYVPAANGYKIFVHVTPADNNSSGGQRIPYVEYKRTGAPDYTPYFIVRYPAWGGAGSSATLAAVWCTVFTTGVVERVSY